MYVLYILRNIIPQWKWCPYIYPILREKNPYHFLSLCVHYAFILYQGRPLCWGTLVSSSSPVGKAPVSLLTSTMCVLHIPSPSEKAYSCPCVYVPSGMEGPPSCVITDIHVCIRHFLSKSPLGVLVSMSIRILIPFSFLFLCRPEGGLVSFPSEFRQQRESLFQSSQAKSAKCLDRDVGEGTLIQQVSPCLHVADYCWECEC